MVSMLLEVLLYILVGFKRKFIASSATEFVHELLVQLMQNSENFLKEMRMTVTKK